MFSTVQSNTTELLRFVITALSSSWIYCGYEERKREKIFTAYENTFEINANVDKIPIISS